MKKDLLLRGAENFLSQVRKHLGKGHKINEWGDGRYIEAAIETADTIVELALWKVQKERRDSL
jgi:hypothetical protein